MRDSYWLKHKYLFFPTDSAQAQTEDHTQEVQAAKDNEGPKEKETSAKRRSTSTEKQPPETKKGIANGNYFTSHDYRIMPAVSRL